MRPGVEHARPFTREAIATAVPVSTIKGHEEIACGELDLARGDLLAQVLRRPPDHQAGDEHGDDGEDEHAVQARTGAAGRDLTELHVEQRHHAAEAGVGVVERVDRAGRGQGRRVGEDRRVGDAEALLDTLHGRADRGRHRAVVLQLHSIVSQLKAARTPMTAAIA